MADIQPWFDDDGVGRCSSQCPSIYFKEYEIEYCGGSRMDYSAFCSHSEWPVKNDLLSCKRDWSIDDVCNPWVLELIKERDELKEKLEFLMREELEHGLDKRK